MVTLFLIVGMPLVIVLIIRLSDSTNSHEKLDKPIKINKESQMNSITKILVVVTTVLGLGTNTIAAANESSIQKTLSQTVIVQGQQVASNLTKQLQHSIRIELNKFVRANMTLKTTSSKTVKVKSNQIIKTTTAEEE